MTGEPNMIRNRDVFLHDPTATSIPNDGVTVVGDPRSPEEWAVLRYELSMFVCEGEYRAGLERVLSTYLAHLNQPRQPAVWVSGFYGSGKSHFVRVLQYLWNDITFPDGVSARGLTRVPDDIEALLRELTTAGRREGGLWAAAGKLGAGDESIQLAVLSILFRSAGLPTTDYASAKAVIWLKQKGIYEAVKAGVEARGADFEHELRNLYVSVELAESILAADPSLAPTAFDLLDRLLAQFPLRENITNDELIATMRDVLALNSTTPGKLPLALLIFDELQQSIGSDNARALEVQHMVEACSTAFGGNILFIGTGQAALEATPQLSRLQDRFTVRVALEDKDVEQVVREVVLRKRPDMTPALQDVLDRASGEINRHLAGTKIGPSQADNQDLVPDYPLLPTRRRFWERVLRAIDRAGSAAQLRTQLRVVHEATRGVAEQPLGVVVGGDVIYQQQKSAMRQSGVLLREVYNLIEDLHKDGSEEGWLRARLCSLIFLIGELPTEGVAATGIRANADTLADLLVEDLPAGSAALRHRIPRLLAGLVEDGVLMQVGNEYRLQTRESAEWERAYRGARARISADDARLAGDRAAAFRTAIQEALKGVRIVHGETRTPRKFTLHFGGEAPPTNTEAVPVWVQDEWSTSEKAVREEAQRAGVQSPIVFVLLPRQDAEALKKALASHAAARETLNARPAQQNTPEGVAARQAMETRAKMEKARLEGLIAGIVAKARVFQGGGAEVVENGLAAAVEKAVYAAVERLFPRFGMVDERGWANVVRRASSGDPDSLAALGYQGSADQHPACKEVRVYLGAGKKGKEVRKHFGGVGYGWPQDAVDGALLALVAGGYVRAERNGQPLAAKQIGRAQIGVTDFHTEEQVISAAQRLQVRKLIQDMGLSIKKGEEAEAIPRLLQRLEDLAGEAGGPPPLPAPPAAGFIDELQGLMGNEQFLAVYEARARLREAHAAWTQARALKAERLPRWEKAQRLLKHARSLPEAKDMGAQMEAIREHRSLLEEPDPLQPLIGALTAVLRKALQAARQRVVDVRARELKVLEATPEWAQLDDEQWRELFEAHHVGPIEQLDVGDDDKLLAALDRKPLGAWETEAEAAPTRMRQARADAARLLAPKAVRVRPPSATLHTADEVDAYLADLRQEIMAHVEAGNPVII
jgi:hypothetical protein